MQRLYSTHIWLKVGVYFLKIIYVGFAVRIIKSTWPFKLIQGHVLKSEPS